MSMVRGWVVRSLTLQKKGFEEVHIRRSYFWALTEITQKCIHILGLDKVDKQTIASKNRILTAKQQLNLSIYRSIDRSINHNFGVKQLVFRVFSASFCVILLVLPNATDRGQNQQLFDFWSLTTFQSRPKKMQLLEVQVYMGKLIH